ncbi:hypothetical protein SEVIR_8G137800v4 [Setaria viridis]|uniref:AAA+ ATPase domain-containing protein n=1 Tax=Setaria viridis TaxID=4556 RepID=A0A4U6TT58_SETVI|nr:disease resistance protein RGA5-like isoform X1 [Setaria viridis]XP_034606923.1 disease resistance protein RGA5-like isoform X1 [Setaria viridis]TKW00827.1 hypothetical protein SEVIR_8G137800v2 [Setaria viridis]TKW00828.1 hypothetical protein SEVIR_8G137800v2 [Setaria viridis]
MEFSTGALGVLVPKLRALLREEYNLQKSVNGRINYLMAELESMHGDLEKVSSVPMFKLDKKVIVWARYVQEISYDIDDNVDNILVQVEGMDSAKKHNNITRFIDWSLNLLSRARIRAKLLSNVQIRHETAVDLMEILGYVKEVKERCDMYNVDSIFIGPAAASIDPRNDGLYRKATALVGINETRDKLIEVLSITGDVSNRSYKGVSIFGSGGLGKTTLARKVYEKLRVEFDCCAFVSVGNNPDINRIFKDVLFELDQKKYENIYNTARDEKQLIDLLRRFLEDKRYFIVIDDIWDIKFWEAFKFAFLENNHGSRIISTTRRLDVAREAGDVYMLEPLSYDNSKMLFYTKIFGELGSSPDDVLDKILKRCGGVPLAIITMASLLAGKPREKWFEVYTSISFRDKDDNQCMDNTMRILSYCYYDMPFYLRTCLLYISVYPAGYTINKDYLIWKWVAEGFVPEQHGIGLFERGERYFIELMNRSMIQPVQEERQVGYVDSCCVHDMVHSLIRSLSCKENLFITLDHEQDTIPQNNIRRISYQRSKIEDSPHAQIGMPSMRSFIACCSEFPKMVPISNFHALRVLALEKCHFLKSYHLRHLGKLLQLRYLGLAGTPICDLPMEIIALKLLQTLDLAETGIKQLPSSIGLLTQLMRLRGMFATKAPVDGTIMKLTSLEELWIDPAAANEDKKTTEKFVTELGNLKKLRVLATNIPAVLDESLEEALLQSIRNMPNLHYLFVQFLSSGMSLKLQAPTFVPPKYLRYLWLGGIDFFTMPEWINSSLLPHLCFLKVCIQDVDSQDMLTLGMLPELCCLHLFTTSLFAINYGGGYFQKLRSLCLARATFSRDKCGVPILPSLEDLHFAIDIAEVKQVCTYYGQSISSFLPTLIALRSIPMLVKVHVKLFCEGATAWDVEEIEAALKHIVRSHGNHPILETQRENEEQMTTSDRGQQPRMDKYRVLDFHVHVYNLNVMCYAFDFTILEDLPSLEKVIARINCMDATLVEVEEAEVALKRAVAAHPMHPTLKMERYSEDKMMVPGGENNQDDHGATHTRP